MKTPLYYQLTEYDCGCVSALNALRYLFLREQIPPEVVRRVTAYTMDETNADGEYGKGGTSREAMRHLCHYLQGAGEKGLLPIAATYLEKEAVNADADGEICRTLHRGGAVIVRLLSDVEHYVLFTELYNGMIGLFDPYLRESDREGDGITAVREHAQMFNYLVTCERLNRDTGEYFTLGKIKNREAILLLNTEHAGGRVRLEVENSI